MAVRRHYSDESNLTITERVLEVEDKYVGHASPKTERAKRRMALHPLLVAALIRHREEQKVLGLYEDEGFVFPTRNGAPMTMSNLRRAFKTLRKNTGLGDDWTDLRAPPPLRIAGLRPARRPLVKVADLATAA